MARPVCLVSWVRTNRRVMVVFTLRTVAIGIRVSSARATLTLGELGAVGDDLAAGVAQDRRQQQRPRDARCPRPRCRAREATASENAADAPKNVATSLAVSTSATPVPTAGAAAVAPTAPPVLCTTSRYSFSSSRISCSGVASGLRLRSAATCAWMVVDGMVTDLSSAASTRSRHRLSAPR